MTERSHGLVLGKFTAGFIGLVAMAALVTGAVAAANAPAPKVVVADATASPRGAAPDKATAKTAAGLEITENPSAEASEHASGGPVSTARPSVKPAASCDPSLDAKEDLAEASAKAAARAQDRTGDNDADDPAPGTSAAPTVLKVHEAAEPPSCHKTDTDGDGDGSGGKPPVQAAGAQKGGGSFKFGSSQKGAFSSGFNFFGRR